MNDLSMERSDLDLNLLRVLDVLLAERSVTRAALRLGRTQPAVSNALHRLRLLLHDDLLVRGGKGLDLTPRAQALRQPIREALAGIEAALAATAPFDPATDEAVIRISTPDRLSLAVIPPLFDRLQRFASRMALQVRTADRLQALALVGNDTTDLAIGWFNETPNHLKAEFLMEESLYCVFRRGHPLASAQRFTLDAVLGFPHIVVSATGGRTAIFDDLLAEKGLRRNALVIVENFTSVPHLLARSDMIGVFGKLASDVFETSFGLEKHRVPGGIAKIATKMVWHARNDRDGRQKWLREQVRDVYKGF